MRFPASFVSSLFTVSLIILFFSNVRSQSYTVPNAQVQPKWVMPLWFETADGQKDTLYYCYDPNAGFPTDTVFGEKLVAESAGLFNVSFEHPLINDTSHLKVIVTNDDLQFIGVTILFYATSLPLIVRWDPIVYYSDSLPFPDMNPAPRAQGVLWFDLPMQSQDCSFSVPILMTDTVLFPGIYCHRSDSILFTGSNVSYLVLYTQPWSGIWLSTVPSHLSSTIKLFPNPAKDIITIESDLIPSNETYIEVYSTIGNLILISQLMESSLTIDISKLLPGAYIIHIKNGSGIVYSTVFLKP